MAPQEGPEILRKIFAPPPQPVDEWATPEPPPRMRQLRDAMAGLLRSRFAGLTVQTIMLAVLVVIVFFGGTLWALNSLFPADPMAQRRPVLAELPPLQPVARASVIVAPVAIADLALRDVLEANAPRGMNGKRGNPLSEILSKAEFGFTVARGPIAVTSAPPGLNISTDLNGALRIAGQIADKTGKLSGRVGDLLGDRVGRDVQKLTARALDQHADIHGSVTVFSRPALLPNWRIEPNLAAQVSVAEGGLTVAGVKIDVVNEVKPLIDKTVNDQIGNLANHIRNDPALELTARREWAKLCRSISLGAASKDAPDLWLEVRPTKAFAAQPQIVPNWVILTIGVQAETRIVPTATSPNCPFPASLELVPQIEQGNVAVALPIDVPFTELSRVMEARLKGKTFPDDAPSPGQSSPGQLTVLGASIAASGERLLISLRVKAKENKSWFGLGAEATVHIWGKPVLDQDNQVMRLTDISLDVQSQAAFALLGTTARAAIPYLQSALEKNATVDLKPFAVNAQQSIETALNEFRSPAEGVEVEAAITGLRLAGIEFDSKTLRVTAEAQGLARALVRKIATP